MYSTILTWFKTYSDLYMKKYYDDRNEPIWTLRSNAVVSVLNNEDEDSVPCGATKTIYPFSFQFYTSRNGDISTITTQFETLLDALEDLYRFDNWIVLTGNKHIKITALSHTQIEDDKNFGYQIDIDITYIRTT